MKTQNFIAVMLLSIFFFSCNQKKVAETIKINGSEISYASDSITLKGYIAFNENIKEERPGIIIVHEWWGHNDYVRKRADMLAELGYTAIAIDMYGNGKLAEHPSDAGKFAGAVFSNLPEATNRFNAAMEVLKAHKSVDETKIAAIGYCFGGSVALTMANAGLDLDAVAAFHSGVTLPIMPNENLKANVLVCNGAADSFISEASVATFTSAMDSIGANYEYINYPNVKHSFTSKEADVNGKKFNLPLEYNAEADKNSWERLQKLLNDTFASN